MDTIIRFPLTIIFLVAAVISNFIAISDSSDGMYHRLFISFLLGASVYAVYQMLFERFFIRTAIRICFLGLAAAFTVIYYWFIRDTHWGTEVTIRTTVIFFILLIAFLWIPVIKSRFTFNQSFMAVFKGFFASVFFTGILYLGVMLILRATDLLIFRIDEKAYMHAANIIFVLLTPVYFLVLIPHYPGKEDEKNTSGMNHEITEQPYSEEETYNKKEIRYAPDTSNEDQTIIIKFVNDQVKRDNALNKSVTPAKFLETLISYIVIPVTAVFTVILLLYILMNITGDFWTDNLMEPLLLSYSIMVIIVYLLASSISNPFARYFRLIFPKVLVPVVLFQTAASIRKTADVGITYGRYYIILFGVFATLSGVVFCILPVRKNGLIAPLLIGMSVISITPPVDAFTISRINQTGRLENTLKRNDMLREEKIIPKTDILEGDKKIIASSVSYLDRMGYLKQIPWLLTYSKSYNFRETFGFAEIETGKNVNRQVFVERNMSEPIPVSGYDYVLYRNFNNQSNDFQTGSFTNDVNNCSILLDHTSDGNQIIRLDQDGQELISFEINQIFHKFSNDISKTLVTTKDMTFTNENEKAIITVIADRVNSNEWESGKNQFADIYILVKIK